MSEGAMDFKQVIIIRHSKAQKTRANIVQTLSHEVVFFKLAIKDTDAKTCPCEVGSVRKHNKTK